MHGNDVRSVFEAATGHRVLVKDWWRTTLSVDPVRQQIWISGTDTWTNKQVYLESPSFTHGDVEAAAANLGSDYAAGAMLTTQEPIAMADTAGFTNTLKIKGLTEMVSSARAGIQAARSAASDLGASTTAFVASAAEVKKQIDAARSDLEFEATQLGNNGPASSPVSGTLAG